MRPSSTTNLMFHQYIAKNCPRILYLILHLYRCPRFKSCIVSNERLFDSCMVTFIDSNNLLVCFDKFTTHTGTRHFECSCSRNVSLGGLTTSHVDGQDEAAPNMRPCLTSDLLLHVYIQQNCPRMILKVVWMISSVQNTSAFSHFVHHFRIEIKLIQSCKHLFYL